MTCEKCGTGTMRGPRYFKRMFDGLPGITVEGLRYDCATCGYSRVESTKDRDKTVTDLKEWLNTHTNSTGPGPTSPPAIFPPGSKLKPQ